MNQSHKYEGAPHMKTRDGLDFTFLLFLLHKMREKKNETHDEASSSNKCSKPNRCNEAYAPEQQMMMMKTVWREENKLLRAYRCDYHKINAFPWIVVSDANFVVFLLLHFSFVRSFSLFFASLSSLQQFSSNRFATAESETLQRCCLSWLHYCYYYCYCNWIFSPRFIISLCMDMVSVWLHHSFSGFA